MNMNIKIPQINKKESYLIVDKIEQKYPDINFLLLCENKIYYLKCSCINEDIYNNIVSDLIELLFNMKNNTHIEYIKTATFN